MRIISGPNQLWVADMTYIRLRAEFVYLAVVLDALSRKVVGCSLDRGLQARLPLNALKQAILNRQPPAGLVHHSDRGVQYACEDYVRMLRVHAIIPSTSRPAHAHDNSRCKSLFSCFQRSRKPGVEVTGWPGREFTSSCMK